MTPISSFTLDFLLILNVLLSMNFVGLAAVNHFRYWDDKATIKKKKKKSAKLDHLN